MWLAHHGILGMKWGVRRYQNVDGSLTPAGQRRYNKFKSNEVERFSKADNQPSNDYYLKKGQKLNRVVNTRDAEPKEIKKYEKEHKNDPAFYSVDDYLNRTEVEGRDFYANWFGDNGWQPEAIRVDDFVLKNDVKVANGKKVIETFINKFGDQPIGSLTSNKWQLSDNKLGDYSNLSIKDVYNLTDTMSINEKFKWRTDDPVIARSSKINSLFNVMTNAISNNLINTSYRSEIIKELKSEGYKAMEDVHDRISDMPIILFDQSNVKRTKSTSGLDYFKSKGHTYTD